MAVIWRAVALIAWLLLCGNAGAAYLTDPSSGQQLTDPSTGQYLTDTQGPAFASAGTNVGQVWPPGTIAYVPCGASINAYTASSGNGGSGAYGNGNGVVFQLAGSPSAPCTYAGQTFHTQSGETIQGDCTSPIGSNTILDGGGAAEELTDGHADGSTGVTLQCLTVRRYYPHTANCLNNQLATYDGWTVRQDTFTGAGCNGIDIKGNAALLNSRIVDNGTEGVFSEPGYSAAGGAQLVEGNEIAFNGSGGGNTVGDDAAGLKSVPSACAESALATQGVSVLNNWVHDNDGPGIWSDCWSTGFVAEGNTVLNNADAGIMCEISVGCTIEDNVVRLNGAESQLFQGDIFVASSSNATVQGNFVEVSARFTRNGAPLVQAQCRGDAPQNEVNDIVAGNTVVFDGYTAGQGVAGQIDSTNLGANCSGDFHPAAWTYYESYSNTFFSPATTDPHWTGNAQGYYTNESLASIQGAPYSNEYASSVATSGAPSPAGCQTIGCTGSGWAPPAPPTPPPAPPAGFYMATTGSDSAAGSFAAPFATLGKCVSAAEAASTNKTCWVRGGTYSVASLAAGTMNCANVGGTALVNINSPNVTISYYAGDGIGSAVFNDGGADAHDWLFCISGAFGQNVAGTQIIGLVAKDFGAGLLDAAGASQANIVIEDNEAYGSTDTTTGREAIQFTNIDVPNLLIANNYVHDDKRMGIALQYPNSATGWSGVVISGNVLYNLDSFTSDTGDIYIIAGASSTCPNTTGPLVENNWLSTGPNSQNHVALYADNATCHVTAEGNVVIGTYNYCALIHGGSDNLFEHNLCDLNTLSGTALGYIVFYQALPSGTPGTPMTGNSWQNNAIVCNSSASPCGAGYVGSLITTQSPLAISDNGYHNYGSGTGGVGGVNNAGTGGAGTETGGTAIALPKITCWVPIIDPSSALLSPPVSMAALAASYGPKGTVPETGPTPSWGPTC